MMDLCRSAEIECETAQPTCSLLWRTVTAAARGPARASTADRPRSKRSRTAAGEMRIRPGHVRAAAAGALSTPGMGGRLGVKVPWRKRWC
jgi:hypothetical protein